MMTTPHAGGLLPTGFARHGAEVNGTRLSYLIGGDGPPLVLVHGWPQTALAWRSVLEPLAREGYTVIAPDLRGTGSSQRAAGGYDKDNQSEDLRGLVRHLGITGKVRAVGHDIGGMVTFAWARRHPEEIERLALLELAVPGFGLEEAMNVALGGRWHFGLFMTPEVPELLFAGHEREFFGWWFDRMAANHQPFTAGALDEIAAAYSGTEALRCGFEHYRTLLDDGRINSAWGASGHVLSVPTLTVGGDRAVGTRLGDSLRAIAPELTNVVVKDSGHFLAEEQPRGLLKDLAPFLA